MVLSGFPGNLLTLLHSGCSLHPSSSVGGLPFPTRSPACFVCRLFDDGCSDDGVRGTWLYFGSAVLVTFPPRHHLEPALRVMLMAGELRWGRPGLEGAPALLGGMGTMAQPQFSS